MLGLRARDPNSLEGAPAPTHPPPLALPLYCALRLTFSILQTFSPYIDAGVENCNRFLILLGRSSGSSSPNFSQEDRNCVYK